LTLATLDRFAGRELGTSQWVRMDQQRKPALIATVLTMVVA